MKISKSTADTLLIQASDYVSKALVIREFWRNCSSTNIFEFSYNIQDKSATWVQNMKSAYGVLISENIIIQGPPQNDFHYELGILPGFEHRDAYYKNAIDASKIEAIYETFLIPQGGLQYPVEKQDELLRKILSEVFGKFGKHIQKFNLYTFLSDDEKAEHFQYTNLFLGLLRLEKERHIRIEWLGSFSYASDRNEYFAECSILELDEDFFDIPVNIPAYHSEEVKSINAPVKIRIADNYSLVIDNIKIDPTPTQKVYLKHIKLDELLDGLSIDELARRYEGVELDDDRWKKAKKRVKNAFTTLNSKINISGIHKKDIFIVSQAIGISLNGLYDFEISGA